MWSTPCAWCHLLALLLLTVVRETVSGLSSCYGEGNKGRENVNQLPCCVPSGDAGRTPAKPTQGACMRICLKVMYVEHLSTV